MSTTKSAIDQVSPETEGNRIRQQARTRKIITTYNYTQIVKKLTPANVDANGVTALKKAVTASS